MEDSRLKECKRFVAIGLALLAAGSLLLLMRKLLPEGHFGLALAVLGGAALLCGNGCILFGLLLAADARHS